MSKALHEYFDIGANDGDDKPSVLREHSVEAVEVTEERLEGEL